MSDDAGEVKPITEGPWAGWLSRSGEPTGTFVDALGRGYLRSDSPGTATIMLETRPDHSNRAQTLHGGFLAAFADHAYFGALLAMGKPEHMDGGVTIDLAMQYCGSSSIGPWLKADVELMRETGRLLFMRLTIWQNDDLVATSSATIRKAPLRK